MSEAQPELIQSEPSGEAPTDGGGGGEAQPTPAPTPSSWLEGLPPDLRENPTLSRFQTPAELAKSYLHSRNLIGGEKIPAPKEDWTEQQWAEHFNALGRPEAPDGYDLSDFQPPEGVPWDDGFLQTMVERLHGRGLSQQQLRGLLDDYGEVISEQFGAFQQQASQAQEENIKSLKKEWGNAYAANVDAANRAFKMAAGRDFESIASIRLEDGTELGNHPGIIKAFATLGNRLSEHGLEGAKETRFTLTPEEAAKKQRALLADPQFSEAYMDKNHVNHQDAVEQIRSLIAMEVGTETVE